MNYEIRICKDNYTKRFGSGGIEFVEGEYYLTSKVDLNTLAVYGIRHPVSFYPKPVFVDTVLFGGAVDFYSSTQEAIKEPEQVKFSAYVTPVDLIPVDCEEFYNTRVWCESPSDAKMVKERLNKVLMYEELMYNLWRGKDGAEKAINDLVQKAMDSI